MFITNLYFVNTHLSAKANAEHYAGEINKIISSICFKCVNDINRIVELNEKQNAVRFERILTNIKNLDNFTLKTYYYFNKKWLDVNIVQSDDNKLAQLFNSVMQVKSSYNKKKILSQEDLQKLNNIATELEKLRAITNEYKKNGQSHMKTLGNYYKYNFMSK